MSYRTTTIIYYKEQKKFPVITFLAVLLFFVLISGLIAGKLMETSAMVIVRPWPDQAVTQPVPTSTTKQIQAVKNIPVIINASTALVRINQLDPGQYASTAEYNTWAYSTCSTAAMTQVMNAYSKHHLRITDVLQTEISVNAITPDLGLTDNDGIRRTVEQHGFKVTWINSGLDDVISIANHGKPVIVGFPPNLWTGGHLLVVRGGNSSSVFLADSSRLNMQVMSRSQFLQYWGGFAVVVEPK